MRYRTIVADPPWPQNAAPLGRQRANGQTATLAYGTMGLEEIAALPVGEHAAPGAHLYLWTTNRHLLDCRAILDCWGFTASTWITWCKEPMGLGGGSEAFANTTEFCVWGRKRFGRDIRVARELLGIGPAELERRLRARLPHIPSVRARGDTGLVARWEEDSAFPSQDFVGALAAEFGWDPTTFAGAPSRRWSSTWFTWKRGDHSQKPEAFLDLVEQTSPGPYLELFARRQRLGWNVWGNEVDSHVDLEAS